MPQLWHEWTVGIEGKPAVERLEELYGAAWKPASSDQVLFSRRKAIVDQIRACIKSGLTPDEAVKEVEGSRGKGSWFGCP